MYAENLALNYHSALICHKTQPTNYPQKFWLFVGDWIFCQLLFF